MNDKLSIVFFSGTVDKLMAASIITAGAAAMGKEVTLFLTFWGLMSFKKDASKTNTRLSKDFEDYGPAAMQAMQEKKVPNSAATSCASSKSATTRRPSSTSTTRIRPW